MIRIDYVGEFGNNLFTYTYSRIVSEKYGIELVSNLPENGYITNTKNKRGNKYNTPPIIVDDRDNPDFISPDFSEKRTYIVCGFFQDIRYYLNREYIKTFFELPVININEEDLVIHIRLNDYKNFGELGTVLNPTYYLEAIKWVRYNKLYIVTDEPTDKDYLSNFKDLSPIIISDIPKHDFRFLMQFRKIIIANSSFSWWAAYLGEASELYSPSVWLRYCTHIKDLNKLKDATIINASWT
jgi:hypothetical protein